MRAASDALDALDAWLSAWNARDAAALAALLGVHGTYRDPLLPAAIGAGEVAAHVARVAEAMPDHRLEGASRAPVEQHAAAGLAAARLAAVRLAGTNTGPLVAGASPLGRPIALEAMLTITVAEEAVHVALTFDRHTLWEQAGLQVLVLPHTQGAAQFGYSMRVASGNRAVPGVIALTWIAARDADEQDHIRTHSREIVRNFMDEPGFIGIVTGFQGGRGFTVTAWEDEAALRRGLAQQHRTAARELRTTDLAPGVWTSVWQPLRINRIWTRCGACTSLEDVTDDHRACGRCGATLAERPPFW